MVTAKNGLSKMLLAGMLGVVLAFGLVVTGCDNDNKDDDGGDSWPNTSGYTYKSSSSSKSYEETNSTSVSVGQKFYSDGNFTSVYGTSYYLAITSAVNCKIIIDFKKFTFGSLSASRNGSSVSTDTINITAGDMVVFRANPDGKFISTAGPHWVYGFRVVAE